MRRFLRDLRYGMRRLAAKPASTAVMVLSLAIAVGLRDLRYGMRRLAASPASTAVMVLSLAIAVGPNCLLFSVLDVPPISPDRRRCVRSHQLLRLRFLSAERKRILRRDRL